jgi:hypothetical protein
MPVYHLPSINQIAEALGGGVTNGEALVPGPGHSPEDRSLAIKCDTAAPGGFVVHSFAGDDPIACRDHVRRKLGLAEFEPAKKKKTTGGARTFSPTVAKYVYRLADGAPYLQVHRLADKSGFPQYHWDGEKWVSGKPAGPKVPYMLPQLIATGSATPIYVVEGEKDAENLARIGFVATTNSEGADNGNGNKWTSDLNQYFKDRHIYIIPDNDAQGGKHAEHVARNLNPVAKSVRIVELSGLPLKGDVSDWLESDSAGVKLAKLAAAAPLWEPSAAGITVSAEIETSRHKTEQAQVKRDEGAALLEDVQKFLSRFIAYPSDHALVAHVLWIAHTHLMKAWESTPRIAFLSPEPASGKTRSMEVTELLVPNAVAAVNVTPAYLFRKVGGEDGPPTILFDEIDTVFGPKAKENEEVRALINAGHRRGAVAGRCVVRGKVVETEEIPAYAAVALAGLGWLPDTILSRSIIIRMRRRAPDEKVEAFRRRVHAPIGEALRRRLAGWAATILDEATEARPDMPLGVEDRNADMWEPLLAIADIAGGEWPQRARKTAQTLVAVAREVEPSLNIRLLADLRTVFGGQEVLSTKKVLAELCLIEDAPWSSLRGKPISDNQLAQRLRQYGVKSKNVRIGDVVAKGYAAADLHDVWRRYLPPLGDKPATVATTATSSSFQDNLVAAVKNEPATDEAGPLHESRPDVAPVAGDVAARSGEDSARNANEIDTVAPVAPVAPLQGGPERPEKVVEAVSCGLDPEAVTASWGNGGKPGLSQCDIERLACWYADHADTQRKGGCEVDQVEADASLRRKLAEFVLTEHVELEFGRVLQAVFRLK